MSDMSEASVFPVEPESGTPGRQYRLALRGNSLNPMIDAATPLLGMVMRLSTMNSQAMPEHLFAQVVTDVQAVEQLLQEQGYEPGVIVSFRYILCTFIDEAALGNGLMRRAINKGEKRDKCLCCCVTNREKELQKQSEVTRRDEPNYRISFVLAQI